MKPSLASINAIDVERMLQTMQSQCYRHNYDSKLNCFFFQLCQPIKKDCLHILDYINSKFVVVEEVDSSAGEVQVLDEIDGGSAISSREFDHLYVVSNALKNYGMRFEKALSPQKLRGMPQMNLLRKDYLDSRLFSFNLAM